MKRAAEETGSTESESALKRQRSAEAESGSGGPSSHEPIHSALSLPDIRSLLQSVGIESQHAAELATAMMANGVDTVDALCELDEAQAFFLGATIGDQAKIRLLRKRKRDAGPGDTHTSTSRSMSLSPANTPRKMEEEPQTFVNGPVPTLLNVTPLSVIGKGAFGVVMSGLWGEAGTPVAMKSTTANAPPELRDSLVIEASMLSSLRHPNILQMYGVAQHAGALYLVTELAEGNLLSLLRMAVLPLSVRLRVCRDVAAGMQYLASNNVVHRDLACRNVLYQGNQPIVKISDFGLSRIRWRKEYNESVDPRLTIRWTPPEAYNKCNWSEKSDVWSLGVLIWEVMTNGMRPYDGLDTEQIKAAIMTGHRLSCPNGTPPAVYTVMKRCWEFDAHLRPSFGKIGRVLNSMMQKSLENPAIPDFTGISLETENSTSQEEDCYVPDGEKECVGYHVNAKDQIIFVEQPIWDQFLQTNRSVVLVGTMVGKSLWDFICGAATQHLYRLLTQRVRETGKPMVFPFRCDSPSERRYLEMQVLPMPCRCLQFRSVTRRVERRVSVQMLLDVDAPRDEKLPVVPMCSLCKKVRSSDGVWREVEDALTQGLLEVSAVLPPLLHDCCEACYRRVAARIPL